MQSIREMCSKDGKMIHQERARLYKRESEDQHERAADSADDAHEEHRSIAKRSMLYWV